MPNRRVKASLLFCCWPLRQALIFLAMNMLFLDVSPDVIFIMLRFPSNLCLLRVFTAEEGWISPNPVFCSVWVDHMTLFSLHPVKVEQYQIAFQIQDHHRSPDTNPSWSECLIILACCLKFLASILLWIFALVFIKILICHCVLFHGLYLVP